MTTKLKKEINLKSDLKLETGWNVVLFNCYCHSFDEAVDQIINAIRCGFSDASSFARSAEMNGSTTVFTGSISECQKVAQTLGSTGLVVSLAQ